MIIEKPPHTPHLRRIFVFEHELIIKSRDIPRVCPQSTPPHTPLLRRYKYWGCLPVPKVRRIDFVEQIRRGWGGENE